MPQGDLLPVAMSSSRGSSSSSRCRCYCHCHYSNYHYRCGRRTLEAAANAYLPRLLDLSRPTDVSREWKRGSGPRGRAHTFSRAVHHEGTRPSRFSRTLAFGDPFCEPLFDSPKLHVPGDSRGGARPDECNLTSRIGTGRADLFECEGGEPTLEENLRRLELTWEQNAWKVRIAHLGVLA